MREDVESSDELQTSAEERIKESGLARTGDTVLILSGQTDVSGATNMLRVHEIG